MKFEDWKANTKRQGEGFYALVVAFLVLLSLISIGFVIGVGASIYWLLGEYTALPWFIKLMGAVLGTMISLSLLSYTLRLMRS